MLKKLILLIIPAIFVIFSGCRQEKQSQQIVSNTQKVIGPRIIIYKTKADYFLNVPIGLTEDKKKISSYPAITDINTSGKLAIPTKLENGFLLDNRGISVDVAFISLTYHQYATLPATPSYDELKKMIIDPDPIMEMYDCGNRNTFMNPIEDINKLILQNDFSRFKKLK
jgi:hypothetical protein